MQGLKHHVLSVIKGVDIFFSGKVPLASTTVFEHHTFLSEGNMGTQQEAESIISVQTSLQMFWEAAVFR